MKWFDESLSREELDARLEELLKTQEDEKTLSEIKEEYAARIASLLKAEDEAEETTEESASEEASEEKPAEETSEKEASEEKTEAAYENAEKVPEEKKLSTTAKILIGLGVLAIAAVVCGLIYAGMKPASEVPAAPTTEEIVYTIPADGNPDDVTAKGSYSTADGTIADRDTVVARVGDQELTLGQLQVYYWMGARSFLNQYGPYQGISLEHGLDAQACPNEEGKTWQQVFLESALNEWHNYSAITLAAMDQDVQISDELLADLENFEETLDANAQANGFENGADMLSCLLGKGTTADEYKDFLTSYYTGISSLEAWLAANAPTEADMEAYFEAHEADYLDRGLTKGTYTVNVRHVLYTPEQSLDEQTQQYSITEEAWAAAEKAANDAFENWKNGGATEDGFAALAQAESQDPGSQANGGLYEGVSQGQMVPEFNDWCFDADRKTGDYGIVKTTYGYHLMYFVSSQSVWQNVVQNDIVSEQVQSFRDEAVENFPMEVDYKKIFLSEAIF